ncbi:MAG: universal stress protein [bacterium]|nr:universal stress protein [bacterium]
MIKKIICPTDFSKAADNGVGYAANFAQVLGAELMLVNLQRLFPAAAAVSMAEGMTSNVRENALLISDRLNSRSSNLHKMFDISVAAEVELTSESLAEILSTPTGNAMIIMGSNGADDLFQRIFGSTTYRVIKSTKSPVLMIPEHVSFGSIQKIVMAWDY